MSTRLTLQRTLSSVLATLVFWTPLSVTVARAQDLTEAAPAETARGPLSDYIPADSVRLTPAEEREEPSNSALREGLEIDPEALRDFQASGGADSTSGEQGTDPEANQSEQEPAIAQNLPSGPSKTAVTPQQISLPKGEGSIEGMGESFTPNLSSGTGTFSVPIALPKGRAGVQPSLALSYATSGGNGIVGIGWSLAMPFISRQTDKGLPRYVDAAAWHAQEDTFMYNGGQELVPIDSATATRMEGAPVPEELSGWQQYRARVEGGFMRFFRSPDSQRWVVQSKDGTRFEFGQCSSSSARIGTCTGPAVQADPEDRSKIFSWQLVRMSDVHGSAVHYAYTQNGGIFYPESLYYTSPASCAAEDTNLARNCPAPLSDYAYRVRFVYEARQDVTSSYLTTWRTEQALRLKRVEVTGADMAQGSRFLVRRYHLSYDSTSYHSLLSQVQVEGRPSSFEGRLELTLGNAFVPEDFLGAAVVGELLPPMRFSYTAPTATSDSIPGFGGIDATVHRSAASPDHSANEGRVDFFDVNSDGLPDLLVTDPARYKGGAGVYFNGFPDGKPGQAGAFSQGTRVDVPAGLSGTLSLQNLNIVPMDVDGDGRVDVLHMPRQANYGYFVLSKAPTAQGAPYAPLKDWSFSHVTDLLPAGETDPRIDLGKDGLAIKTLDVNNDSLIDVVRTTGSGMQSWLNLGRYPGGDGRFGSATWSGGRWVLSTLPVASCLPFAGRNLDFGESNVRIADMNGDGLQDIVKVAPDEVVWWPGRGEGAFGDGGHVCDQSNASEREVRMEHPPRELNTELAALEMMDVNHDGAADLLQVGFDHLSVWFNQGGTGFTKRIIVKNTPFAIDALDRVRVADIDGSSTADLIFADSGNYRWIDPMGGVKPRLLRQVDNGLGALTTLSYSSSAVDYLRDLADSASCDPAALDCFTWQREPVLQGQRFGDCDQKVFANNGDCVHRAGGSPVISTVVRKVSTTDRLDVLGAEASVSETEYHYHDGYYEGIEQEFRGFGAADAVALGDEYEPTSYTRTYFHQGRRPNEISADRLADNPNEALKGREFLTEVWNEGGTYLKTSHATYAVRKLLSGLNKVGVSYAYVKSSDEYRYDTTRSTQRKAPTPQLASVVREQAGTGIEEISAAAAQSGDAKHPIRVRDLGYAHVRTSIDRVDNVGNLLEQTAWGRGGRGEYGELVADESIVQHSVPARVQDFLCGNSGWLWRTAESWVSASGSSEKLGYSTTRYSRCGDVVSARQTATLPSVGGFNFAGDGSAQGYTQTSTTLLSSSQVDLWGQATAQCAGADLQSGTDGCLRLGSVTYDPAYQQLVLQESIATDAAGGNVQFLATQASWDRGLGVLRSATDPNGKASEVFYDGLGRLTGMVVPPVVGCEGTRVPSTRITYQLTSDPESRPLSRVSTTTLLSCANYSLPDSQIVAYAYVDGLGRPRAALSEGESDGAAFDDGQPHPFILSGRQIFTTKGQPRLSYQPMFFAGSPDDYAAVVKRPNTPYKRALFDAFGRPTLSINEDGSYSSISYHALSTDVCDEVDNGFGADGMERYVGSCTTERTDGHGRGIDQQLRQVTLAGAREQHRLFTYYRADGAVLRVMRALTPDNILRPEGGTNGLTSFVERRFYYDSLGRRIASEDPDTDNRLDGNLATRTWRYLFNPVGDLAAVRDPRGCGQNFYYDLAGRLIGETYVGCTEAQVGEVASLLVPSGSVGMGRIGGNVAVHTRSTFDEYLENTDWVNAQGTGGVKGRLTSVEDRGQRTSFSYDARGQVTSVSKQLAVIADQRNLTPALDATGRPRVDSQSELAPSTASVVFAPGYDRYNMGTTYDHAGRVGTTTYPRDGNYEPANTYVRGRLAYYRNGAPRRAELLIGDAVYPVVDGMSYTRDGLPAMTRYGDGLFTGRKATESRTLYDARRRPVQMFTARTPAAGREAQTLGAVSTVNYQRLNWDGASNLFLVEDRRIPEEWPAGHKPVDQHVTHDALYRVGAVSHVYRTASSLDTATDWRTEEARHRAADPMHATAAPMLSAQAPNRVVDLEYSHDWLANMTSWQDDAHVFYERSIGQIANGNALSPNQASPAYRPSALYLTSDLATNASGVLGGWLEADYGVSGNMLGMTVHAECTHVTATSCVDPGGPNLTNRRTALRNGCDCDSEQHYVYRYDELNRMHEARRYDRGAENDNWSLAARQRYRYDGANQRTVKQTFDTVSGEHRAALTVYPGEFEQRGMVVSGAGDSWQRTPEAELQYSVAGARVVWKNSEPLRTGPDANYRTSTPPQEGLYHWYRADSCPLVTGLGRTCIDRMGHRNLTNGWQDQHPTVDPQGLGGQAALVFGADSAGLGGPPDTSTPVTDEFVVAFVGAVDQPHPWGESLWGYSTYRADGSRDISQMWVDGRLSPPRVLWESYKNYGSYTTPPLESLSARTYTSVPLGQPFIATLRATRARTELYLNGALVATAGPAEPAVMATDIGSAGAKRIGELLMYQRALDTTTELPALHRYLGNRYGIAMANTPAENVGARGLDPSHRITFAISNLIQSTSAVVDLVSGELVEAGGFYPNGAREEWLGASDQVFGAEIPLEHVGFTGKEADEEVGLTYFGERYLIQRIGRWATPDPLAVHAMGGGEVGNSYHYVSGNLLQARDPLGLDAAPAAADRQDQARIDAHEPDRAEGRAEADRVFQSHLDAAESNALVDDIVASGNAIFILKNGELPHGRPGKDVKFDKDTQRYVAAYTEPKLSSKHSVDAYQQRMKHNILQQQNEDNAFAKTQVCFLLVQVLTVATSGVTPLNVRTAPSQPVAQGTSKPPKPKPAPAPETILLEHGTTLRRAQSLMRFPPDPKFVEPGGVDTAGGFSTARPTDTAVGSALQYARGKSEAFPEEGGAAVLQLRVPKLLVDKALKTPGEVRFMHERGLEGLRLHWDQIPKTIRRQ